MKLLLLSNSTNHGDEYLGHAIDTVLAFLDGRSLTFVPYALADYVAYTAKVAAALEPYGVRVKGIHEGDPLQNLSAAEAIFTGGGNTFRLLKTLQSCGLTAPLRARVEAGMPYMGASAGTNIAGPSIRTTNDMPIVFPQSFDALGLVGVQINPHFLDHDPSSTHNGETRAQRIAEFLEENDAPVLGLREGTWLSVEGSAAELGGTSVSELASGPAVLFSRGMDPRELSGDVTELLAIRPRFDVG